MRASREGIWDAVLAAFVLVVADVLLFHVGLYFPFLAPSSSSGRVEEACARMRVMASLHPGSDRIIVMGDSASAETMDERVMEVHLAARGLRFQVFNAAQGGSSALTWRAILLHEPFSRVSASLVVFGMRPQSVEVRRDNGPDLELSKSRMGIEDGFWFARSYDGIEARLRIVVGGFFRTPLFRRDLLDLLAAPRARIESVAAGSACRALFSRGWRRRNDAWWHVPAAEAFVDRRFREGSLAPEFRGQEDVKGKLGVRLTQLARERATGQPVRVADQPRMLQLARLVERLNKRGTRVLLAVLPDSPYPSACRDTRFLRAFVGRLAGRGLDVELWEDDSLLDELEAPDYFRDNLHVNAHGSILYSESLATFLAQRLAP